MHRVALDLFLRIQVLRLHPAIPVTPRVADADDTLPSGDRVLAGTAVFSVRRSCLGVFGLGFDWLLVTCRHPATSCWQVRLLRPGCIGLWARIETQSITLFVLEPLRPCSLAVTQVAGR